MQKTVSHSAPRVWSAIRSEQPARPWRCASCRTAAARTATRTPSVHQRRFTSAARPRHEAPASPSASTSRQDYDKPRVPQTHYDFFPRTFPDGPPPRAPFTPDLRALRREFLQLQAKSHPDLAGPEQKRHAEATSARINEAYRALQDPLQRAQYLLSLRGVDVEDETAKLSESALLMEVMEAREAVEEVQDEEELQSIRDENNGRIEQSVRVLEEAFAREEVERAAQEAVRLRYWMNIEESIHGWEKGKGGGVLHH